MLLLRYLTNATLGVAVVAGVASAGMLAGLAMSFRNLPDVTTLRKYVPFETTEILDINGKTIARLHGEANREVVRLDEISPEMKLALLGVEDSHFYVHKGINVAGIGRATLGSVRGGLGSAGGGSTLTMQLVKNLFLTPERTVSRKAAEAVLSLRVEQVFDKDEILELYLNQVYWGHNLYGVQTAAESYFDKNASELNLAEGAMLAGMLQAPEGLSPFRNFDAAKARQKVVLQRLVDLGWVTPEVAEAAAQQELKLGRITSFEADAPAIADAIEEELIQRYGREAIQQGGLRVQSSIDLKLQEQAQQVVDAGAEELKAAGRNANQVALVALDPRTGFIKALVGGVKRQRGQFNRALQALRQPGSAFKPFVYYTALSTGLYWHDSILQDVPSTFPSIPEPYEPKNYDEQFYGPVTLKQALELSRNVPTVKLAYDVGINNVIESAHAAGIHEKMDPVLSLALGSGGVTPLELTSAYATFANGGVRFEPTLILQVVDASGRTIERVEPKPERVLDPWAVAALVEAMQGAILQGTGTAAQLPNGRPVAGKTGTTSDYRDAWFVGFTPQLATGIWIGNDDNSPMTTGTTGGVSVAPIWKEFMVKALEGVPPENFRPSYDFTPPRPRNRFSPELR
jgi:penicillin-binding protein 1A